MDTSGTTTGLISHQTTLDNYHNHLNFAFRCDDSGGDLYFVYSVGDTDESSLVIKRRTSAGVESTILTDTEDLADLTTLRRRGGRVSRLRMNAYSFTTTLFMILAPIQTRG